MMRFGHRPLRLGLIAGFAAAWGICSAAPAGAVILFGTAERNTSAPTGALAGSGWQFVGVSDSQSGTAIGANHFITAKHIAGGVGTLFSYQGANYTIAERFDSPTSDLTIFRVEETFGSFAPLYLGGDELGKNLVVIGRGAPRAGEVTLDGAGKGWYWGAYDGVQSWGENQVSSIEDGGDSAGDLLRFSFDADGGPNESHLAVGDSGGAVFIQEDGVWKLAGINYAVDGYYSFTGGDDPGFLGAIYDARGLYVGGPGDYEYVPATEPDPVPGGSYATRISSNQEWIRSIVPGAFVAVPEPGTVLLILSGLGTAAAAMAAGTRRRSRP